MKKCLSCLLALIISLTFLLSFDASAASLLAGDIDNDGTVSASDARLALRFSVGLEDLSEEQQFIGDVDNNEKIDASDARTILRMSVGLDELQYIEQETEDGFFEVHFIDVGQADCMLVICDGETLLIDGGNTWDADLIISYITDIGVTELDYVLSTHAHEDHVGGLSGILKEFTVTKAVFAPETGADTECYKSFLDAVEIQELELTTPPLGYEISLGSSTVMFIDPAPQTYIGKNNTSIVTKITYGNTSFLFAADAEREAEQIILDTGIDISADVLKVGHHGGATSTTYPFLREIMPEIAVISSGDKNSYGHPTDEVLSRLRDADARVYRTDMQGHIKITSDGENLTVTTQRNQDAETNPTIPSAPEEPTEPETPTAPEPDIPSGNGEYIGNINSKKLHLPTCSTLPKEENRIYFAQIETAINEGYEACSRCKPF